VDIFLYLELPPHSQFGAYCRFGAINTATWKIEGAPANPWTKLRLSEHEFSSLAREYNDRI